MDAVSVRHSPFEIKGQVSSIRGDEDGANDKWVNNLSSYGTSCHNRRDGRYFVFPPPYGLSSHSSMPDCPAHSVLNPDLNFPAPRNFVYLPTPEE